MASRHSHLVLISRVPVCFFTAVCLLLTVSAQVPETSDEVKVQTLIIQLEDTDPGVRGVAAYALGQIGSRAQAAAPALLETLKDRDEYVRGNAADALVKIGPVAVPALVGALRDEDVGVRGGATYVLGQIGPEAQAAIPALLETLKDQNEYVRGNAADALVKIGPVAVPALVGALRDAHVDVRGGAAYVLGQIGPEAEAAAPALIAALKDQQEYVRSGAADALGRIRLGAKVAIPALIEALHDKSGEVRSGAAYALGEIGPEAEAAVPMLIEALKDQHEHVRGSAADALVKIGPVAVPALVEALRNEHVGVRGGAARVLGQIGPEAKTAAPVLLKALKDQHVYVRRQAASALGKIGPEANAAIPALIDALHDLDKDVRIRSASSLGSISTALTYAQGIKALSQLKSAHQAVRSSVEPEVSKHADQIQQKIDELVPRWPTLVAMWALEHPYITFIIIVYPALLLIWLSLLWLHPVWLLKVNEKISDTREIKLWGVTLHLRYLLLIVGPFYYGPAVLDSWIAQHVGSARKLFATMDTVKEREIHVPVPVELDGKSVPDLSKESLWPIFSNKPACLLIWGEGGSGKTSLACKLGKSAMAEKKDERLCKEHLMLPVLIEPALRLQVKDGDDSFLKIIEGRVKLLINVEEPVPLELVKNLLKRRRLIVIVDSFSELSEELGKQILTSIADAPINACIITSRNDEPLKGEPKNGVRPSQIVGNMLAMFMGDYLSGRGKRGQFNDEEFFDACRRLSVIVGNRYITALLAKLYADLMIASKEGTLTDGLPESIPDLMLRYLNQINRGASSGDPDNRTVHAAAQVIAWECLKKSYRPMHANRNDVVDALDKELGGKERALSLIIYLEQKLKIIQTIGDAEASIRFVLDPVSEYLAGMYLVNHLYKTKEELWRKFLKRADEMKAEPLTMMGFLFAVRDCCLKKEKEAVVPGFVVDELEKWLVKQLMESLTASSEGGREQAANWLGVLGPAAKAAAPALLNAALLGQSNTVNKAASSAFGKLEPKIAVALLVYHLNPPEKDIRQKAIDVLKSLIEMLKHTESEVRNFAVFMLSELGPWAKDYIFILDQASKNPDPLVRRIAASAIQRVKSLAKDIPPQ